MYTLTPDIEHGESSTNIFNALRYVYKTWLIGHLQFPPTAVKSNCIK